MKKYIVQLVIILCIPASALCQQERDALPEEAYFDFWVGTWELTWEAPDGTIEKGTNYIEKILDGQVILENFEATSGRFKGYVGKSFSVYDQRTGSWKQTWVDSNRGYIALEGYFEGDKRMFVTERLDSTGNRVMQRMVFYDITDDTFTWDWESSSDGGATWQLNWRIWYRRAQ